jgi:hypothetical protein
VARLAILCIAAYGFLIAERGALPPSAPDQLSPRRSRDLQFPRVTDPEAPPLRPERLHRQLNRDGAQTPHRSAQLPVSQRAPDEEAFRTRIGASISTGSRVEWDNPVHHFSKARRIYCPDSSELPCQAFGSASNSLPVVAVREEG